MQDKCQLIKSIHYTQKSIRQFSKTFQSEKYLTKAHNLPHRIDLKMCFWWNLTQLTMILTQPIRKSYQRNV